VRLPKRFLAANPRRWLFRLVLIAVIVFLAGAIIGAWSFPVYL
jgi:hypothetical protein